MGWMPTSGDFTILEALKEGLLKNVYKIQAPDGTELALKEIRFGGTGTEDYGDSMNIEEALYELNTIKKIATSPTEKPYFPKHVAAMAYLHPAYDPYTGECVEQGEVINLARASSEIEDGRGVSFFIVEEFVQGRFAEPADIERAKAMREEGMRRSPRIWLTADTDENDVMVCPDGALKFVDVGNFNALSRDEMRMLDDFMAQEQGATR